MNKIFYRILQKKIDIRKIIDNNFFKESNLYNMFIELMDNSNILKNKIKDICKINSVDKTSLMKCDIDISQLLKILENTIVDIISKELYDIVHNEWVETVESKYGKVSEDNNMEILINLWKHADKLKNAINYATLDFLLLTFEDIWEDSDISIIDVPLKRLESKYNDIIDDVQVLDMNLVIIEYIKNLKKHI